jgi:hypothetical protein
MKQFDSGSDKDSAMVLPLRPITLHFNEFKDNSGVGKSNYEAEHVRQRHFVIRQNVGGDSCHSILGRRAMGGTDNTVAWRI